MGNEEIEKHLELGEDSKWEFKSEISHPDDLSSEIVAMANSEGGTILLGVSDKGEPTGNLDDKETMNTVVVSIENISRNNIEPALFLTWEKIKINGHTILAIKIPKGPDRPYRTNKGVYYLRVGTSKKIISRGELAKLFQSTGLFYPDESPVLNTDIADIDSDYLNKAWPELVSIPLSKARLKDCGIISTDESALTIGGLICYGKEPQKRLPYARITAIRFPEGDIEGGHRYLERLEIEGRIEDQAKEATMFLTRHLGIVEEILTFASETQTSPPKLLLSAIQEGIINALVHRDYTLPSQIRLFVFDDRIEILSPGRLLNTVNLSELKLGCHAVRNRIIFAHCLRLKLVYNVGLGIPTMFRLTLRAGLPEPEISLVGSEFRLVFRRNAHVHSADTNDDEN
ncbi:MAG: RNA-binding domain-containing protein [bacterium]